MLHQLRSSSVCLAGIAVVTLAANATQAGEPAAVSPETMKWFRETEQALMDAIGPGNKAPWDRVMDPSCVITSEEGAGGEQAGVPRRAPPPPEGLTGGIAVKDVTVQEFPGVAVARFLAADFQEHGTPAFQKHSPRGPRPCDVRFLG